MKIKLKLNFLIFNSAEALEKNQDLEFERNFERFKFLKVKGIIFSKFSVHIKTYICLNDS